MVIRSASLETVCGYTSKLPKNDKPEIALAGKSNVGKSSMINALLGRKSLARTSGQPGKTQTINFYNVNDELYLIDLPGYGYTKVSLKEKGKWGEMTERYLCGSKQLKAVFLLVDARHDPGENDRMMYEWISHYGYSSIVIATKADKIKKSQLGVKIRAIRAGLGADAQVPVIAFSAESGQGRDEIWAQIEGIL